jgi:hypothetical protein
MTTRLALAGLLALLLFLTAYPRGTRNVYTIEAGPHRFSVDAAPDQTLTSGSAVTLSADAAQTWAVRD